MRLLTALNLTQHHHRRARGINIYNEADNRISGTDREGSNNVVLSKLMGEDKLEPHGSLKGIGLQF